MGSYRVDTEVPFPALRATVTATHIEQLERLRTAGPQHGLASLAGGWDGSEELVTHIEQSSRSEVRDMESLD